MINIVDHAWQFELQNFSILPTVIRVKGNGAKAYFYSGKQKRILRKKEQSNEGVMVFMKDGALPQQNYLKIENVRPDQVEFSMILQSQIEEQLKYEGNNVAIVKLEENEDKAMIIQCSHQSKGKTSMKCLLSFEKANYFWRYQQQAHFHSSIVQEYLLRLWSELPKSMKIQSNLKRLELILHLSPTYEKINIVWCNELSFSSKEFYEIHYSYKTQMLQEQKKQHVEKPQQQVNNIIRETIDLSSRETIKVEVPTPTLIQQQIICNGCGRSAQESTSKEVSNSDVITLRKRNKLSIRGITAQYLLICQSCYYQLDE